jgi:FtsH-binding integral membrane protein
MTDRRRPAGTRQAVRARQAPPTGPHLGPFPITPTGVLLVIALVGSIGYVLYTITVRDTSQIPLLASGAAVLGIVFVAVAITGLLATWRSSIGGRDGRAIGHALIGGLACLAAAGCFAAAIILGMVGQSP